MAPSEEEASASGVCSTSACATRRTAPQATVPPCQGSTLTECLHCPAQVGAWGNCSQPCGTGVANRSVICIDSGGATVNSTLCPGLQPEHQAYCLNKECDFCSTTDCSKQVSTGRALLPQAATPKQRGEQVKLQFAHQSSTILELPGFADSL